MPADLPLARNASQVFAALGDETRLRLVSQLCTRGPLSISSLTSGSRITRQAVTKHLLLMEEAGLVRGSRRGRERIWELEKRRIKDARKSLDLISEQWDAALERLRNLVEEPGS